MIRDMTKCVRCQRCVAMCRYGQGVDALVISGTKHGTFVGLKDGMSQKVSNCVTCGQCVLVCPTGALGERDETDKVIDYLYDPEIITVVQFAPAIRVGFGEEFGLPPGANVQGQIISACRKLGFDIVLDTNFAADVVIMEEGTELLSRLRQGPSPNLHLLLPGLDQLRRTTLSGGPAAPVEHQVAAAVPRRHRQDAICPSAWGSTPKRIRVVSIMPCIAKKDEIVRPQLIHDGIPEVDVVLTTREFARLLRREGIDFKSLEPSEFDNPYMSEFSGAGAIFGTTGGVMEAALRTHLLRRQRARAGTDRTDAIARLRRRPLGHRGARRRSRRGESGDGPRPQADPADRRGGAGRHGGLRLHRDHGLSGRLRRRRRHVALEKALPASGREAARDAVWHRPKSEGAAVAQQSAGAGAVQGLPRTAAIPRRPTSFSTPATPTAAWRRRGPSARSGAKSR